MDVAGMTNDGRKETDRGGAFFVVEDIKKRFPQVLRGLGNRYNERLDRVLWQRWGRSSRAEQRN